MEEAEIILNQVVTSVNVVAGAALGASFYVLVKTQPYLVNRSYDPKFNASYISRFITGVIGGVILAIALGPFVVEKLGSTFGKTLTPGVLALLGGFSAEAVEAILNRLVEVLLAAIRGNAGEAAQGRIAASVDAKTAKVESALDTAIDTHLNPNKTADETTLALRKVRDELAKAAPPAPPKT